MSVDHSINVGSLLGVRASDVSPRGVDDLGDAIKDIARDVRAFVVADWPVDTATSLQEWEVRGAGLWLIVRNPVDYAEYVHRSGDPSLVHEEIRDYAVELVSAATPDLRQIIADNPADLQVAIPFFQSSAVLTGAVFASRAAGFDRVGALTRNRLRAQIADRRPRARQVGR